MKKKNIGLVGFNPPHPARKMSREDAQGTRDKRQEDSTMFFYIYKESKSFHAWEYWKIFLSSDLR